MNKKDKEKKKKKDTVKKVIISSAAATGLLVNNTYDTLSEVINTDNDAESLFEEEIAGTRLSLKAKIKIVLNRIPVYIRALVVVPLWVIGWLIMLVIEPLWNVLLAGIFKDIAFWLSLLIVVLLVIAISAKILLPDVPLKKIFNKKNLLIISASVLTLGLVDKLLNHYVEGYGIISSIIKFSGCLLIVIVSLVKIYFKSTKKSISAHTDNFKFEQ